MISLNMSNSKFFEMPIHSSILPKSLPNRKGNCKYNYDRSFFKEINTPEKAYFLGFLLGDGSINLSKGFLCFNLNPKDSDVLEKLIHAVGGSLNQIKYYTYKVDTVYLALASVEMIADLIELGVPKTNKTFNAKPINLDLDLMPLFWRGLFDADGSIARNRRGLYINLSGTKSIVKAFIQYLGYDSSRIYTHYQTFVFQKYITNPNEMTRIYHLLYGLPDVGMQRKKNLLQTIINERIEFEKNK